MKKIVAEIDEQGNVTVKTEGFAGATCLEATREIESALGATESDTKTAEFHRACPVKNLKTQGK